MHAPIERGFHFLVLRGDGEGQTLGRMHQRLLGRLHFDAIGQFEQGGEPPPADVVPLLGIWFMEASQMTLRWRGGRLWSYKPGSTVLG